MRGNWDAEIVRVLNNWAMYASGGSFLPNGISPFPAYNLAQPGPRAGNVMPCLIGEGIDADKIIKAMPERYKKPISLYYCWASKPDRVMARECCCALNTFKSRLDYAHQLFRREWYERSESVKNRHCTVDTYGL